MSAREALPNCRLHETQNFLFRGHTYTLGVGRYADGRVAEVFIDCSKESSETAHDARDAAVCLSIALQFGTPIEAIRSAVMREENGAPSGIIGKALDMLFETNKSIY